MHPIFQGTFPFPKQKLSQALLPETTCAGLQHLLPCQRRAVLQEGASVKKSEPRTQPAAFPSLSSSRIPFCLILCL